MKHVKNRKLIFLFLGLGLSLFAVHYALLFFVGEISVGSTLSTQYKKQGEHYVIRTKFYELQSPIPLVDINLRPTCPGHYGVFLTKAGLVEYEIGLPFFSNTLPPPTDATTPVDTGSTKPSRRASPLPAGLTDDASLRIIEQDEGYDVYTDTLNGYIVEFEETEETLMIRVPRQGDLVSSFTIYPSAAAKALKEELVTMMTTARYPPEPFYEPTFHLPSSQ